MAKKTSEAVMEKNTVQIEVRKDIEDVITTLQSLREMLPELTTISKSEKQSLSLIGNKKITMVLKALSFCEDHSELVPSHIKLSDFQRQVRNFQALEEISRAMLLLQEEINDTKAKAGHEAHQSALAFYHNLKRASKNNIPGSRTILDEMQTFFKKTPKKDSNDQSDENIANDEDSI